ncbi:MAG: bile acid:sodium symporter family protein [Candidatus Omnitrophica bacterium]|nr:bile acid:sodium symporter family protein [Candidatus Omnitrophota bacterium]
MPAGVERFLKVYTKYMAIWVIAVSAVAYFRPAPFVAMKPWMDSFFALTMFGIGVVLHVEDFKNIAKNPVVVLIGTIAQFSIMPLGAFLLAKAFSLPPAIAVGLILTGSAPGAMASNVLSYIARADVAYSVSLTSVSTLLTPVMTPGLTYLLAGSLLKVDFWSMFTSLMAMVIIPLILGVLTRHYFKKHIEKVLSVFPAVSVTFIVFICALVIALNKDRLIEITGLVLVTVIFLNAGGLLMGYGVGKLAGFSIPRRRSLSIEIGMQNAGLGTVLALKHFTAQTAIPAAAFVFICILTASVIAEFWRGNAEALSNYA